MATIYSAYTSTGDYTKTRVRINYTPGSTSATATLLYTCTRSNFGTASAPVGRFTFNGVSIGFNKAFSNKQTDAEVCRVNFPISLAGGTYSGSSTNAALLNWSGSVTIPEAPSITLSLTGNEIFEDGTTSKKYYGPTNSLRTLTDIPIKNRYDFNSWVLSSDSTGSITDGSYKFGSGADIATPMWDLKDHALYISKDGVVDALEYQIIDNFDKLFDKNTLYATEFALHNEDCTYIYPNGKIVAKEFVGLNLFVLSGTWIFNNATYTGTMSDFLYPTEIVLEQPISFSSNGNNFTNMRISTSFDFLSGDGGNLYYNDIKSYHESYGPGPTIESRTWTSEEYKTVDFGTNPQLVSQEFYEWFTRKATKQVYELIDTYTFTDTPTITNIAKTELDFTSNGENFYAISSTSEAVPLSNGNTRMMEYIDYWDGSTNTYGDEVAKNVYARTYITTNARLVDPDAPVYWTNDNYKTIQINPKQETSKDVYDFIVNNTNKKLGTFLYDRGGYTFTFEIGMTWEEFINSDYNTDNFFSFECNNMGDHPIDTVHAGYQVYLLGQSFELYRSDLIIDGATYSGDMCEGTIPGLD